MSKPLTEPDRARPRSPRGQASKLRGRGIAAAPANRFESFALERDQEFEDRDPRTRFYRDVSRSIVSRNQSPDVPFETSLNPYRGCEHGCSYCYARPTHEFLGLSAGLDFETKIFAKSDAADLLRRKLDSAAWKPQVLALSGVTDPYQPVERRFGITRSCLEVLAEFRNPVGIVTKSALVRRDIDVLQRLAQFRAASVTLSITSLDPELARRMEPRAAQPDARIAAVRALASAGIPVGVNVAPIVPGLNDHEIPAILQRSAEAGARWAGYMVVRLPYGVKELFEEWLAVHYPDRREKVLNRLRSLRAGKLNDPHFGSRMVGRGFFSEQLRDLFELARRRAGLQRKGDALSCAQFRRPRGTQLALF